MRDISSSGRVASGKNQNFKFLAWSRHYFQIFWELELLFPKDERNLEIFSGFDLGIRFLSTRSKHSISRGRISMPSLADCLLYLGRSSFYLQPRARLARCIPRRSASLRMRSVAGRKRERERGTIGISENDFERFVCVCVEVARCSAPFKSKLLWSMQKKKNRREKSCFAFKGSPPVDNDWWASIEDRSKYSRMRALIKIQDTNFAK